MLSGSITKGLLVVCIPIMAMGVIQSLFNIVDLTVLKTFSSDGLAVGAVGVCSTLITLISNLVIGIAIVFAAIAGLGLTVIGVSFAEIFLGWVL